MDPEPTKRFVALLAQNLIVPLLRDRVEEAQKKRRVSSEYSSTLFRKPRLSQPSLCVPVTVLEAKDRRQCVSCTQRDGKKKQCWTKCKHCGVFLCPDAIDESTSCWTEYHNRE